MFSIFRRHDKKEKKGSTEFSRFFRDASSGERKKLFEEAARKASEDQRRVVEKSKGKTKTA